MLCYIASDRNEMHLLILVTIVLSTILKLLRPGGTKSLAAENMAIKQQLMLIKRRENIVKSPPLSSVHRAFFALIAFLIPKDQIKSIAVILSPETIFKFHRMLKNKKYRELFSQKKYSTKPGPKGPLKEVIDAIVEMKEETQEWVVPRLPLQYQIHSALILIKML